MHSVHHLCFLGVTADQHSVQNILYDEANHVRKLEFTLHRSGLCTISSHEVGVVEVEVLPHPLLNISPINDGSGGHGTAICCGLLHEISFGRTGIRLAHDDLVTRCRLVGVVLGQSGVRLSAQSTYLWNVSVSHTVSKIK